MIVDIHSHLMPAELIELLAGGEHPEVRIERRNGEDPLLIHARGLRYPVTPLFTDLDTRLEQMDVDGIDVSIQSAAAPFFFYELPPAQTVRLSMLFNEAVAAHAAESGGRIRGMASVPLNLPGAAAEELRRARDDLGLVGVEIGTSVGAHMLDAPELDPFFEAAAELRMPVMLHPHTSMLGEGLPPGLDRYFLSNLLGNSLETATAASRLILGGVLDRHPDLLIQLVHGGGYFPYQLGRLQHGYEKREAVRETAQRGPREYLDNFLVDTVLYDATAIGFLLDLFGPDRVVFGTDLPFDMADRTALEIRDSMDPEVASKVLGGNADRAYGLGLDQSTLEATR